MSDKIKLTPAEWIIMKTVWELDRPASVREVLEHAFPNGVKPALVMTARRTPRLQRPRPAR